MATVVRTLDATSAKPGGKALLDREGNLLAGWIGGGCARGAVGRAACEAITGGARQRSPSWRPRARATAPPRARPFRCGRDTSSSWEVGARSTPGPRDSARRNRFSRIDWIASAHPRRSISARSRPKSSRCRSWRKSLASAARGRLTPDVAATVIAARPARRMGPASKLLIKIRRAALAGANVQPDRDPDVETGQMERYRFAEPARNRRQRS